MKRLALAMVLLCFASPAMGGMRRPIGRVRMPRAEPRPQKIVAENRVAVAPFAVPVAVPVATIAQPTLFYRYGEYVAAPATSIPASADSPGDGTSLGTAHPERGPSASGSTASPATGTIVTGHDAAVAILTARCAKCHSGPLAKGGKQFFDAEGHLFARLPRHVMLEMVEPDESGKQRMPPADLPKLTEQEIKALRDWAKLPRDAVY